MLIQQTVAKEVTSMRSAMSVHRARVRKRWRVLYNYRALTSRGSGVLSLPLRRRVPRHSRMGQRDREIKGLIDIEDDGRMDSRLTLQVFMLQT